jgi:hypothetical protein
MADICYTGFPDFMVIVPPCITPFKGVSKILSGLDCPRYVNKTGRNILLSMQVAWDKDYLYFYLRTEKSITPQTDPNWMMLLIRAGDAAPTGRFRFRYLTQ